MPHRKEITSYFPQIAQELKELKTNEAVIGTITIIDRHQRTRKPITKEDNKKAKLIIEDIINTEEAKQRKSKVMKIVPQNSQVIKPSWFWNEEFKETAENRYKLYQIPEIKVFKETSKITEEPLRILYNNTELKQVERIRTDKEKQQAQAVTTEGERIWIPYIEAEEIEEEIKKGKIVYIETEQQEYITYQAI